MTQHNARLELTWIGKEQRPKRYALIPHTVINDSMSLQWLVDQHAVG